MDTEHSGLLEQRECCVHQLNLHQCHRRHTTGRCRVPKRGSIRTSRAPSRTHWPYGVKRAGLRASLLSAVVVAIGDGVLQHTVDIHGDRVSISGREE